MAKEYHTRYKETILAYLKANSEKRVCAADVFVYMQNNEQQVNLATVYRNLEKLTESGKLLRYKTAEKESCLYQYVDPDAHCHDHLHLHCKRCGKIIHLECEFMQEISEHLARHHQFMLECQGSVLTGLCEECRRQE